MPNHMVKRWTMDKRLTTHFHKLVKADKDMSSNEWTEEKCVKWSQEEGRYIETLVRKFREGPRSCS